LFSRHAAAKDAEIGRRSGRLEVYMPATVEDFDPKIDKHAVQSLPSCKPRRRP